MRKLAANRTRSTCVSDCVRLLRLRRDVLVVLAVDVDLVAIILFNGTQLPLRVSSKHLIDRDNGDSLLVPLHLLLVDVVDVLRHASFVVSRSFGQVWKCSFFQEMHNSSSDSVVGRPVVLANPTARTMKCEFLPAVGCALRLPAVGPLFSPAVGSALLASCRGDHPIIHLDHVH